jgi:transglutaminase/protease-like cytokinesis protein 3
MFLKKIFVTISLVITSLNYSQNFSKVDSLVSLYPSDYVNIDDLVLKINSDFSNESDKARAIFCWVCKNISYDVEFAKKLEFETINAFSYKTEKELIEKEKKFNSNLALSTFLSKTAVCYGYSALYCELAIKLGLECKLIRGNLKNAPSQIGANLEINHGWNIVKVNGEWKFIDCTIAAGKISSKTQKFVFDYNDAYFFTEPKLFFLNHFPENEKWLFVDKKSKVDYINLPIYFPDFLRNESKLILPEIGNFSDKDLFEIKFNNFNIDHDYLEYKFSNDTQKVYVEFNFKPSNYTISLENKANQTLQIFINKKLIVMYNIILK